MDPYNTADAQGLPPRAATAPIMGSANPYAAPSAVVRDVHDAGDVVLASRLSRLGAALLDSAIVVLPLLLIAIPAYQQYTARAQGLAYDLPVGEGLALFVGLAFIAFGIVQLVMLYRSGQTVGKKIVGIRIVRPDGSRASFPRLLFLRYFVPSLIGAIPLVGPFFSLANVLFIFGEERRCLHDRIADTIVVDA